MEQVELNFLFNDIKLATRERDTKKSDCIIESCLYAYLRFSIYPTGTVARRKWLYIYALLTCSKVRRSGSIYME